MKRFSMMIRTPEIKFLNKSCAPNATATPKRPNPAMIGPTFIPQISKMATIPIKK